MPRPRSANGDKEWLPLGEASRLLGVTPVTLRQWADRGLIRTFRTAGGHRRFAREDIQRLTRGRAARPPVDDLADRAIVRLRQRLHSARSRPALPLGEGAQERLRALGRRMVEVALRYHTVRRDRTAMLEEARALGQAFAEEGLRHRLPLSRALEAFSFHRTLLLGVLERLTPSTLSTEEALGLVRSVTELTESALLALVARYEGGEG